ncbi:SDR family NAD(P)-dependent oxidoreductase [Isoptericola sp. NPDC019482]|uniref:SDR family NAD(P)-dependent oxidoreductase n=1 Tax=Isoptericola sp. NPDC019482 TaxID=3154688 RepID=UPI00348F5C8C
MNTQRRAVVLGATGGIGSAVALELATDHELWLVGRDEDRLRDCAARIVGSHLWRLDLESDDVSLVPSELGEVDVLILAAGWWRPGRVTELSPADLRQSFAVNAIGPVQLLTALLPRFRAPYARVIALSSTAVHASPRERAAYVAAKVALESLLQAVHEEEGSRGTQITIVRPGRVSTAMHAAVRRAERADDRPPVLEPADFAAVVRTLIELPSAVHVPEVVVRPALVVDSLEGVRS